MAEGIQIFVFSPADLVNPLTIIGRRWEPTILDELNRDGGGSFKIRSDDAAIVDYPTLLDEGNIVQVKIDGVLRQTFEIERKSIVLVSEGEHAGEWTEVSGSALLDWFTHATLLPEKGISQRVDERVFNFASQTGAWYNAADWSSARNEGAGPEALYWQENKAPVGWPKAMSANWIWSSHPNPAPIGDVYFRREFTTSVASKYRIVASADNYAAFYFNGARVMSITEYGAGRKTFTTDIELDAGNHTLAILARNTGGVAAGVIMALCKLNEDVDDYTEKFTNADRIVWTGDNISLWRTRAYPATPPGWTIGQILITLLDEAKARNVTALQRVTTTFTATADSNGVAWNKTHDLVLNVGDTYRDVLTTIMDAYADVWMSPDYKLHAAMTRGVDRSVPVSGNDPVAFRRGLNVLSAETAATAEIANTAFVKTSNGLVEAAGPAASLSKYGRREVFLSATNASETGTATALTAQLFNKFAQPRRTPTLTIYDGDGYTPWKDFGVGDWILAPSDTDPKVLVKRRIASISASEDADTGRPVYVCEIDSIQETYEERIARWLQSIDNSSKQGGVSGTSTGGSGGAGGLPDGGSPGGAPPVPYSPDTRMPTPPTGTAATADIVTLAGSRPQGVLSITWAHNDQATDGTTLVPEFYEVWIRENGAAYDYYFLGATTTNVKSLYADGLRIKKSDGTAVQYQIVVRAKSTGGSLSDFSQPVLVTMVDDVTAPLKPSTPTVTASGAVFKVVSDGKDLNGSAAVSDYDYTIVEGSPTSGGTYVQHGTIVGAGEFLLGGFGYTTRHFRVKHVDRSGNISVASTAASSTTVPLVDADIVLSAINAATTQITNIGSDSILTGAILNSKLADNAVTLAKIADQAIDLNKLNTVVNDKITKGITDASNAQLAADAARKLVDESILSGHNLVLNGGFESDDHWTTVAGNQHTRTSATAARTGAKVMFLQAANSTNRWPTSVWSPASKGRTFYAEVWVKRIGAWSAGRVAFVFQSQQASGTTSAVIGYVQGNTISESVWTKVSATYTIPDSIDAYRIRFAPWAEGGVNTTADYEFDDMLVVDITDAHNAKTTADAANLSAGNAQSAADLAKAQVTALIASKSVLNYNGDFERPIVSPPEGWPTRFLGTVEPSATTARSGSNVLRLAPTTTSSAYGYTDYVAASTGRIFYVEYWARLREELVPANAALNMRTFFSWLKTDGSTSANTVTDSTAYGYAPVPLSALSTTTWTKVVHVFKFTAADIIKARFGPSAPVLAAAGNSFELDDVKVLDITDAQTALDAAKAAQAKADSAFTDAQTALYNAGLAQDSANGKNANYYTATAPAGTGHKVNDVWFQQSDNKVHLWDGSTWQPRADTAIATAQSAANAAASAASTADGKAVAAQTAANNAQTAANNAQTAGDNAAILANSIVKTSTADATGTPPSAGALWNKTNADGSLIIKTWTANAAGTAWVERKLDDAVIGNLNAATINAGIINAARYNAADIRAKFIEAGKITAADVVTGTLTSASGVFGTMDASVINAGTLNAARLLAGDVRAKFLEAGLVTAADMVTGTITAASGIIGSLDAGKVTTGEMDGIFIKARSIAADRVVIGRGANLYMDEGLEDTGSYSLTSYLTAGAGGGKTGKGSVFISQIDATQRGTYYGVSNTAAHKAKRVRVAPGSSYRVGAWVKTSADAPVNTISLYVRLYKDSDNTQIFTTPSGIKNDGLNGRPGIILANTWTWLSGMVKVPDNTENVGGVLGFYKETGYSTGDTRFSDPLFQQAAGGELIVDGSITGTKVDAQSVAAVTGQFISLNVTQLTATTGNMATAVIDKLWTDVVRSRKITTDMLVVGRGINALYDEFFEDAATKTFRHGNNGNWGAWGRDSTVGIELNWYGGAITAGTSRAFYFDTVAQYDKNSYIPVEEGQKWRLSAKYSSATSGPRAAARVIYKDGTVTFTATGWAKRDGTSNGYEPAGSFLPIERVYTVPSNVAYIMPAVQFESTCTSAHAYGGATFTNMATASLIADGAVIASSITASEAVWTKVLGAHKINAIEIDTNNLSADTGFVSSMRTNILTADVVNSTNIHATNGITSKHTITGATVQTLSTAARGVKINSTGIHAYSGTGVETFNVDSANGNVLVVGGTITGPVIQSSALANRGIKLNSSGMSAYSSSGALKFYLDGTEGDASFDSRVMFGKSTTPHWVIVPWESVTQERAGVWLVQGNANGIGGDETAGMYQDNANGTFANVLKLRGANGGGVQITGAYLESSDHVGAQFRSSSGYFDITSNSSGYMGVMKFTGQVTMEDTPGVTGTANCVISPSGIIQKTSSASRFKVDPLEMNLSDRLLEPKIKDWIDRNTLELQERLNAEPRPHTKEISDQLDAIRLNRIPGVIAEEVEVADGAGFVTYGLDGIIESVAYDRYALARTAVLNRKLDAAIARIAQLEMERI